MYFQSAFFTLASLAALVSSAAIPEADASNTIEARVSPGFYFCKDVGFNGQCYFDASPFGNCGEYIYSLPCRSSKNGQRLRNGLLTANKTVTVGSDFNDQVSSAGPNNGLHCILYA